MDRKFQYTLSFNSDTEKVRKDLTQLQNQIQSLINASTKVEVRTPDYSKAVKDVSQLSTILKNSIEASTGKLNLTKFSSSIDKAKISAEQLRASFYELGPAGDKAFAKLADAVLDAEIPLKRTNTLLQKFSQTLVNTAKWQISSNIMHGLQSGLEDAFSYAQKLDKSLNDIRIVTGYGADQMAVFAKNANTAAKSLRSSTLAYTDAALIYYQQGLTGREITERTNATIKLSNVTGDTVENVSNQLTAVWNNFAKGSENLEYYVDVMTALGAATASSTDEIATGLEKFAAIAETTGLSYEYATSALATVTDKTRQSAEVVGTAFKTLFARIQDLELGKTLDDGTSLGKYSQALYTAGINIKDSNGQLKEMDDILDAMGDKWGKLSKAEQVSLAQTVAGTRQYTQLIALMDNWDFFKQNVKTARSSSGTLETQAQIYAESWEAANKKVQASAEEIYSSLINDKFFIKMNNFFADTLGFLDNVIDGVGGLKGTLSILSTILLKTFSGQVSNKINSFGYNMQLAANSAKEIGQSKNKNALEKLWGQTKAIWGGVTGDAARQEAQNKRSYFVEAAMDSFSTGEAQGDDLAVADMYYRKLELQKLLLDNNQKLTEEQREQLKLQIEQYGLLKDQYEKSLDLVKVEREKGAALTSDLSKKDYANFQKLVSNQAKLMVYEQVEKMVKAAAKAIQNSKDIKTQEDIAKDLNTSIRSIQDSLYGIDIYNTKEGNTISLIDGGEYTVEALRELNLKKGIYGVSGHITNLKDGIKGIKLDDKVTQQAFAIAQAETRRTQKEASANKVFDITKEDANRDANSQASLDLGDKAVALAQAFSSLTTVVNSAEAGIKVWGDSTKSIGEKIETSFSSGASAAGGILSMASSLKVFNVEAGPAALAIAGIYVALRAIVALVEHYESLKPSAQLAKLQEQHEKDKEAIQKNIEAYDELKSTLEEVDKQKATLNTMTKGTTEWYQAIYKLNKETIELLKNYKLLNKENYKVNDSGLYELTARGEENVKNAAYQMQQEAIRADYINEINYQKKLQDINNQKYGSNKGLVNWFDAFGASSNQNMGASILANMSGFGIYSLGYNLWNAADIQANMQKDIGAFSVRLSDMINQVGTTIEDTNLVDNIEKYGYQLSDQEKQYIKLIQSSKEATSAFEEQAESSRQNTELQNNYWQSLAEQNLTSDEYYNSLTASEQEGYAKMVAASLKQAADNLYETEYKDKGIFGDGLKDKDIQREYARAMGYDVSRTEDLFGNKAKYYKIGSDEAIEVSDEVARKYLATIAASDQLRTKFIEEKQKELGGENSTAEERLLLGIAQGVGTAYLKVGETINSETLKKLLADDDIIKLFDGLGFEMPYVQNEASALGQNPESNSAKILEAAGFGNQIKGQTQSIVNNWEANYSRVKEKYGVNQANSFMRDVFNLYDEIDSELKNKYREDSEEYKNYKDMLNTADFSSTKLSNDMLTLAEQADLSGEGIAKLIEKMEQYDATSTEQVNSYINNLTKILNKVKGSSVGDTLTAEEYAKLTPEMQKYYVSDGEGGYTLISKVPKSVITGQSAKNTQDLIEEAANNKKQYSEQRNALVKPTEVKMTELKTSGSESQGYNYEFTASSYNRFLNYLGDSPIANVLRKNAVRQGSKVTVGLPPELYRLKGSIESVYNNFKSNYKDNNYGRKKEEYDSQYSTLTTKLEAEDKNIDVSSISTIADFRTMEKYLRDSLGSDSKEYKEKIEQMLKQIVATDTEKYSYISNQIISGNWDWVKNQNEIINAINQTDLIEKNQEFVNVIKETSDALDGVDKSSAEYQKQIESLTTYFNDEYNLGLTADELKNSTELQNKLRDAATGSASAIRALYVELLKIKNENWFSGEYGELISESYIQGKNVPLGNKVNLDKTDFELYQKYGYQLAYDGTTHEWSLVRNWDGIENYNPSGNADLTKIQKDISALETQRSILQSQMEHAYDQERRDYEQQEIKLVDSLIAKQKALLGLTEDQNEKLSIQSEIQSLMDEKETLELQAIANKYQEIEDLLSRQKNLWADISNVRKAQGITDIEALQYQIEGINYELSSLILSYKNLENITARYNANPNDKHTIEQYLDAINNLADAESSFYSLRASIVNEFNSIFNDSDSKVNNYIEGLDHISEGIKGLNEIIKSSNFFLTQDSKTMEKIYDLQKGMNKLVIENNKGKLQSYLTTRKTYSEAIKEYETILNSGGLDEADKKMYEELLQTTQNKVREIENNIQTTWQSTLETIHTVFEDNIEDAIKNFESAISPYMSLDNLKKAYDFQKEESDQLLDAVTQTYELSKLSRTITQEIGSKTSLKAQNSLKQILEEINDLQKNKTELSEQELKNLQQRYELRLAEIALEEAQWNKTTMRLQRNANGSWNYVYTSTDNELAKAQQNLEDKQQEIYKSSLETVDNMSDKLISALSSYSSGYKDIMEKFNSGEFSSTEEMEAAIRLNSNYLKQAESYAQSFEKALKYGNIKYSDTDLAKSTGTSSIAELLSNAQEAANELTDKSMSALADYVSQTNDLNTILGFNTSNALGMVNSTLEQARVDSSKSLDKMNEASTKLNSTMEGLNEKIKSFRDLWSNMSSYIESAFPSLDSLMNKLKNIYNNLGGSVFNNNVDYAAEYKKAYQRGASQAELDDILAKRNAKVDYVNANGGKAKKLTGDEILKLDTGGYTGTWGSEGRVAMLHEKELVLNREDTANILTAVNAVRGISDTILSDIVTNAGAFFETLNRLSSLPKIGETNGLRQDVHIEASFPNVSDKNEIEAAFTDLVNQAAQFASIKNL